jgi:hypothetical protein
MAIITAAGALCTFHISHRKAPATVRQLDDIAVTATCIPAGFIVHGQLQSIDLREPFRKKISLELGNDLQFVF